MSEDKQMKMLTKEEIQKAKDLPVRDVEVPEWGGIVRMQTLSGAERDSFADTVQQRKKGEVIELKGLKVFLLSLAIVGENGERLFSEADLDELNAKSVKVLETLFEIATEMNGIGEEEEEELRKN